MIPDEKVRYLRRKLLPWGRENFADFPWRQESSYFHALIVEILLQRTRAGQVAQMYELFRDEFPDYKSLAKADVSHVEKVIVTLGLKWKARFLVKLGRKLLEMDGRVPANYRALLEMPGVGPYAAAAYLSLHRGKRAPIIDSNVVRFYGRFFGFDTDPETRRRKDMLELAERVTPVKRFKNFNYALIDFTRVICGPKALHGECPLADKCHSYGRDYNDDI